MRSVLLYDLPFRRYHLWLAMASWFSNENDFSEKVDLGQLVFKWLAKFQISTCLDLWLAMASWFSNESDFSEKVDLGQLASQMSHFKLLRSMASHGQLSFKRHSLLLWLANGQPSFKFQLVWIFGQPWLADFQMRVTSQKKSILASWFSNGQPSFKF